MPPRSFVWRLVLAANDADVTTLASQIAYSAVFAIGPLLSLTLVLVNVLPEPAIRKSLDRLLDISVPEGTRPFLEGLTRGLMSAGHPLVLVGSLLGLLWSVSSGTSAVVTALERIHRCTRLGFVQRRLRAAGLGVVGALGLTVAAAAVTLGPGVASFFARLVHTELPALEVLSVAWVRLSLAGVAFALVGALFFAFGTLHRPPVRAVTEGAVLTGVIAALASAALSAYLTFAPRLGGGYGAATSFFGILLWLYVLALALLLGAVLTRLREPSGLQEHLPRWPTSAVRRVVPRRNGIVHP